MNRNIIIRKVECNIRIINKIITEEIKASQEAVICKLDVRLLNLLSLEFSSANIFLLKAS